MSFSHFLSRFSFLSEKYVVCGMEHSLSLQFDDLSIFLNLSSSSVPC